MFKNTVFTILTATAGAFLALFSVRIFEIYLNLIQEFLVFSPQLYKGVLLSGIIGLSIVGSDKLFRVEFIALKQTLIKGFLIGIVSGFVSYLSSEILLSYGVTDTSSAFIRAQILSALLIAIGISIKDYYKPVLMGRAIMALIGATLSTVIIQFLLIGSSSSSVMIFVLAFFPILTISSAGFIFNKFSVKVLTGDSAGRVYHLSKKKIIVGYKDNCQIVLNDFVEVCGNHLMIEFEDNKWQAKNLHNGGLLLVNYRLVGQQILKSGDIIKIGDAVLQFCKN